MLAKPDVEVVYDEAGVAVGVKSEGQSAKARFVVGDPGYFPGKVRPAGKVVRAIAIMVRGRRSGPLQRLPFETYDFVSSMDR